jgi:hypothetical protein
MALRRILLAATIFALAPSVLAAHADAQPPAESGIARDGKLGTPLACLHVLLLDAEHRAVAHTVTDSAGTFVLVAPAAGVYRVGFDLVGWDRLEGPIDTLRDGEMRERAYPITFGEAPSVAAPASVAQAGGRTDAGWNSAIATTPDADIRFPLSMRRSGKPGSVVAQYVVDATGRVRADSWRPVASSDPEYLAALRAHAPAMRYQPARLDGHPVCQLVRNQVRFEWVGPMPTVTLSN